MADRLRRIVSHDPRSADEDRPNVPQMIARPEILMLATITQVLRFAP